MKTKKEIEQLAGNVHFDMHTEGLNADGCFNQLQGYIKGYTQCQEDVSKLSEWQLCPKCFGEGIVQNVGTSTSLYRTCPVCNGNKTLIKPIV